MSRSAFLTSVEEYMYARRYAKRTIQTYLVWIRRFILFHNKKHPNLMGDEHVEAFLNYLVLERHVAASTQALALNALSFLYKDIIKNPLSTQLHFVKSIQPRKLPIVLTPEEISRLLESISPNYFVLAALLYGSGLRLMEAVRLRVHDIDFDYNCIRIWNGKGGKHRTVTLAPEIKSHLNSQRSVAAHYLELDLQDPDYDGVWLPHALRRKYKLANKQLGWHYLFLLVERVSIQSQGCGEDIILMKVDYNAPFVLLLKRLKLKNMSHPIRLDIALPHIYSVLAPIFVLFKNSSAIRNYPQLRFIRMCSGWVETR